MLNQNCHSLTLWPLGAATGAWECREVHSWMAAGPRITCRLRRLLTAIPRSGAPARPPGAVLMGWEHPWSGSPGSGASPHPAGSPSSPLPGSGGNTKHCGVLLPAIHLLFPLEFLGSGEGMTMTIIEPGDAAKRKGWWQDGALILLSLK